MWGGWVLKGESKTIYFAGDTAYEKGFFKNLSDKVGPIDIAALPIGAYLPRDLMKFEHMDPGEAVQAHSELQAKTSVAIHWATFQLGDETSDDVRRDFSEALKSQQINNFKLLSIGEALLF